MTFQTQFPGGGSAKAASAATAYSMIMQAINTASVDGGYKIAEQQGVFAELAPLLDPALSISSAKITEAFDNATDANSLASSSVFRDLVNAGGYVDQLGRSSAELFHYYGGYLLADMELVRTTSGDPTLDAIFGYGIVFNADKTAIYYGASGSEIGRRPLSEAGNILSAGAETKFNINTLYGGNSILGFDMSPDESRFLIADNTLDDLYEVILMTPGDMSTATVGSNQSTSNVPRAPSYNQDGTAAWYYNTQNNYFVRWPLSTPYDFSTRGTPQNSSNTGSVHNGGSSWSSIRCMRPNADETEFYVVFATSGDVYLHERDSAGADPCEVSASSQQTITLPSPPGGINSLWFENDDLRDLWVADTGSNALQYRIPPTELQAPA